jgi:hypothetical protein
LAPRWAGALDLCDDADARFEKYGQHGPRPGSVGGPSLDLGQRDLCFTRGEILSNADEDPVQHVHSMVSSSAHGNQLDINRRTPTGIPATVNAG